jgi:D-glycero-D-manno-heptose 1,7-bisphosphate phosphatase
MRTTEQKPAVFLDRDGTLMEEVHYCADPALVRVFEGVAESLKALRAAGFLTILVTNQSGIARGLISPAAYESVHARLLELLGPGTLDASYMSPDAAGSPSPRRKPEPGMLLEAARDWNLALDRSWMIGDKAVDMACGRNAAVAGTILVRTGHGRTEEAEAAPLASHRADGLVEAVDWLLRRLGAEACNSKGPSLTLGTP